MIPDLQVVADDLTRHPGDERQHVDVHGNPVRQRLRPARFRKGVAGGPQHRDEDLGPAHLSGCPVDHLHGVTGEVDEHPLTGGVNLPQRRLQAADPFAIEVDRTRSNPNPSCSPCPAAVFFPQQRQRHVRPPQFAVHHRPVRNRPLFRRHRGRWRKQQRLELGVVESRRATANPAPPDELAPCSRGPLPGSAAGFVPTARWAAPGPTAAAAPHVSSASTISRLASRSPAPRQRTETTYG